jgi:hypothetical protein
LWRNATSMVSIVQHIISSGHHIYCPSHNKVYEDAENRYL